MTQNLGLEEIRQTGLDLLKPLFSSYGSGSRRKANTSSNPQTSVLHTTAHPRRLVFSVPLIWGDIRFWCRAFKGNYKPNLWTALLVNHPLSVFLDALVVSLESSTACQNQWVSKSQGNTKSKVSFPKVFIDALCSPLKPRGAWP